jgi:hypothetical protein
MQPSLPDIAQTILAAHRAAAQADQFATIAIRMLVKSALRPLGRCPKRGE